jgi:hypothetical protein
MRPADARTQVEAILDEFREVQSRVTADLKRRDVLWGLLRGYADLFPEFQPLVDSVFRRPASVQGRTAQMALGAPAGSVDERPRGQEAVRRVLADSPGKWWTVGSVVKEMEHRDWLPDTEAPMPAIRTALERLASNPQHGVRKDKGKTGAVTFSYHARRPEVASG